jgi:hypothetical protein
MIFIKILGRSLYTKAESGLNHRAYNAATVCTPAQIRTEACRVRKRILITYRKKWVRNMTKLSISRN